MKYYVLYNTKEKKYVSKFTESGDECYLTDHVCDLAVWDHEECVERIRSRLKNEENYEVRCLTDKKCSIESDLMSLEELPELVADLKRWETSLLMCAIVGILDGNMGACEGEHIKKEVEKVSAVRGFIEKGLARKG